MKENLTYKKLGDIATFSRGLTFAKGDVADISSKKVLRSNNIDLNSHSLNFDDVACLNEDFIIPDEKKLHKGDIFICMSNGSTQHLGKVAFIEEDIDYAFGGFMGAIHPNQSETNPKFIFYACFSSEYRRFLASVFNGVNINNLKWSDLSKFSIPVPPLETQSRIVSELDLLQSILDKQQAQLKELDKLAQAVFYDMFGDPVENEKGWEVKKLEEIGKVVTGNTPSTKDEENYSFNDYSFVKPSDIAKEGVSIIESTEYHISTKAFNQSRQLTEGSVLTTCIGIIGKVGILKQSATCNQQINAIIPSDKIEPYYLAYTMIGIRSLLEAMANAPVVPIINKGDFSKVEIPVPPLSLQQSFAAKIESIEKQKAAISQSMAETQKLFDYTMDKYFG